MVSFRINSFASVFTPGHGVTLCGHSSKILAGVVASSARKAKQKRTEQVSNLPRLIRVAAIDEKFRMRFVDCMDLQNTINIYGRIGVRCSLRS